MYDCQYVRYLNLGSHLGLMVFFFRRKANNAFPDFLCINDIFSYADLEGAEPASAHLVTKT